MAIFSRFLNNFMGVGTFPTGSVASCCALYTIGFRADITYRCSAEATSTMGSSHGDQTQPITSAVQFLRRLEW